MGHVQREVESEAELAICKERCRVRDVPRVFVAHASTILENSRFGGLDQLLALAVCAAHKVADPPSCPYRKPGKGPVTERRFEDQCTQARLQMMFNLPLDQIAVHNHRCLRR